LTPADERNQAKEAQMRTRIMELVGSIVGPDKVRVQVTSEIDYNRREIVKQDHESRTPGRLTFNPDLKQQRTVIGKIARRHNCLAPIFRKAEIRQRSGSRCKPDQKK